MYLASDSHYFSVDVKVLKETGRQFAFQMLVHAKKNGTDVECRKHACAIAKSKELLNLYTL
jgi:hypothetical protein